MDWIKVTPETMPPEEEKIIATIKSNCGQKYVLTDVKFRPSSLLGTWWYYSFDSDSYEPLGDDETVTHWMPRLRPAED